MTLKILVMLGAIILTTGCVSLPPRVDPYSGLLPAGKVLESAREDLTFSRADLKRSTAYVVTGANFEAYSALWKQMEERNRGGNFGYNAKQMAIISASWNPSLTTTRLAEVLSRYFKEVEVVSDLAEAQRRNAQWIVLFDHALEYPQPGFPVWINTTVVELLDGKLLRFSKGEHMERKEYPAPFSDAQVMRNMGFQAKDVQTVADRAMVAFEDSLKRRIK